tara:strand:- start:301 stop:585 length:285 start_codon:yes stop_codon:yes gene_type:complete
MGIPTKIKRLVLIAFVNKCRELYQIAFFQWRRKHPHPLYTKIDEIEELIEFRIEYTFKRYQIPSEDEEEGTVDSIHTDEDIKDELKTEIKKKVS